MLDDDLHIDCETCAGAGSSACNDCVLNHLLANDGGPIDLVVVRSHRDPSERAIELFVSAGLLDDPPVFVGAAEFASSGSLSRGPTLTG